MQRTDSFRFEDLRVPLEVWGDGGRPLVFLPGLGAHPRYYRDGLARLARHFTVYVPDLSFATHDRLPRTLSGYLALAEALTRAHAPSALCAGHSLGGLVALLGSRPAIALSPMVPVPVGWPSTIARAAVLQISEYLGLEGGRGPGWAARILADYFLATVRRPRCLFPVVSKTLSGAGWQLRPSAPAMHVILARFDQLYLRREYVAYLAGAPPGRLLTRTVRRGHDWPVTDPALLESEVLRAASELAGAGGGLSAV